MAEALGFDRPFENSMDAVSDRDPFVELLFDLALLAVHASALGEEVVLFATKEFGFIERSSALGSGSSLMPQKKNPDAAELVRGKSGRVVGDLVALLTTLKGLPLTYDRDLQEDKAPVFDAVTTVAGVLNAIAGMLPGLEFNRAKLRSASTDPELFATDLAEQLVRQGTPFRSAHESVGRLYSGPVDAAAVHAQLPGLGMDASELFAPEAALERRGSPGGPSPGAVAAQLSLARSRLAGRGDSLSSLDRSVGRIEELLTEEPR